MMEPKEFFEAGAPLILTEEAMTTEGEEGFDAIHCQRIFKRWYFGRLPRRPYVIVLPAEDLNALCL